MPKCVLAHYRYFITVSNKTQIERKEGRERKREERGKEREREGRRKKDIQARARARTHEQKALVWESRCTVKLALVLS